MQIFVKGPFGKTHIFDVYESDTINSIKHKLEERIGVPLVKHALIFGGRKLDNSLTVNHYKLKKHSTIYAVFMLNG